LIEGWDSLHIFLLKFCVWVYGLINWGGLFLKLKKCWWED